MLFSSYIGSLKNISLNEGSQKEHEFSNPQTKLIISHSEGEIGTNVYINSKLKL